MAGTRDGESWGVGRLGCVTAADIPSLLGQSLPWSLEPCREGPSGGT